jgi:predicted dehydrogenase
MSGAGLATALIGFGKMAQGYAADAAMARHYRYAAHAQVLAGHPAFEWLAVVDPDTDARAAARTQWNVAHVAADAAGLGDLAQTIEVVVLATPPQARLAILDRLPNLRAVLVEKPLGVRLEDSRAFLEACARRKILVQVNLWRRADDAYRGLAGGGLARLVGRTQAAAGVYGNGLKNNGTHMIDFARMLFGEIESIQCVGPGNPFAEGPIAGDRNPAFVLAMRSGVVVSFQPLRFAHYRENGLVVWGEHGRLDVLNEGLTMLHYPRAANRAMSGEHEIASDAPVALQPTVGSALYRMYDNLADALAGRDDLWSPGESALQTERAVDTIVTASSAAIRVE